MDNEVGIRKRRVKGNKVGISKRGEAIEKKYILTSDVIVHFGVKLHRIKALKDFGGVKKVI